jgi:hypothetical protein
MHANADPPPGAVATELPAPDTRRWVAGRKAAVVAAVRAGVISFEEACRRYALSGEELAAWERLVDRHGTPGLRVTRLKQLRQLATPPAARPGPDAPDRPR